MPENLGDCVIINTFLKINVLSEEEIIFSQDLIVSSFEDLTAKSQYLSAELNNAINNAINNAYRNFVVYDEPEHSGSS